MENRAAHYPRELSGGQQQRISVARAIVGRPPVVLADEPTGNLDSVSGKAVIEALEMLNRDGTTLLIVTHNEAIAARATTHISVANGRVDLPRSESRDT